MDIHDFWISVFNYPYNCGYIHIDIQAQISECKEWISVKINIHKLISMFDGYQSSITHALMDIYLDIIGFPWISMH